MKYVKYFNKKRKGNYVIAVHIRTGYLSDFGEKVTIFFNNKSVALYIKKINKIISKHITYKLFIISESTHIILQFQEKYI